MVSVIIIEDEYPDLTTIFEDKVTYDIAGVYHVINPMTVGSEIAYDLENHKDITEEDIKNELQNYFSTLIDSLIDEVMEKLENCESCTCEKINGKWIYNRTRFPNEKADKTRELVNEIIIKEDNGNIEYIRTYENANNLNIVPDGSYDYMIEFFSEELINPKEDVAEYGGHFSADEYNGTYIRDCMELMNDIEKRAFDMKDKYSHLGCDVTIGDFNVGCQYGMAIYVWVPKQK